MTHSPGKPVFFALSIAALLCAMSCERTEPKVDAVPVKVAKDEPSSLPESQYSEVTPSDFTAAWARISADADEAGRNASAESLRSAMSGKRFQWTGLALASVCLEVQHTCNLKIFRSTRDPNANLTKGFFPTVAFDSGEWTKLNEECAGETQCVVTFDARLTDIRTEVGLPLVLKFDDAKVSAARPPTDEDGWYRKPPAREDSDEARPLIRTGTPTSFDASKLQRKTF